MYLENGDPKSDYRLVLAHGAGAPMDSPFMDYFAEKLAEQDIHVVRFEFPYMQQRRETGRKRPPDRQPILLESWRSVIRDFSPAGNLFIGGKSMGGRMASLIAEETGVAGLVCLGYPFHAIGKPEKPRTEHLENLKTPTLIVQGTRDSMGKAETVSDYTLSSALQFCWLEDGDHSFKPRKSSGRTEEQNWEEAIQAISGFLRAYH